MERKKAQKRDWEGESCERDEREVKSRLEAGWDRNEQQALLNKKLFFVANNV